MVMSEATKGRIQGFLFGSAFGLAIFTAMMNFVVTPKTKAALAETRAAQEQADNQKWSSAMEIANKISTDGCQRMLVTQQGVDASTSQPVSTYTVLYDLSAPATSPLELLNVVRPGLGTLVAKLAAHPKAAPRWVVPGKVKPLPVVDGDFYSWVNVQTGQVETYDPALAVR